MRKEEVITLIIIFIIAIGDIFSQNYTKKCMDETCNELYDIKEEAISGEKESNELVEESKQVYEHWKGREKILSYYIEHTELEKVNVQLRRMQAYFEGNIEDQCIPEIENGIYVLEHIKMKQAFNLKNIF